MTDNPLAIAYSRAVDAVAQYRTAEAALVTAQMQLEASRQNLDDALRALTALEMPA